jgi:hypothetical protein
MARGFKTGGRQKGSLNKRTAQARENARAVLDSAKAVLGDKMADIDAHTLLKLVYRNTDLDLGVRLDAAKAALRHETPVMATSANLTGVTTLNVEIEPKRFEVLRELLPTATTMAVLINPNNHPALVETQIRQAQQSAYPLGLPMIHVIQARTERDLDSAFSTVIQREAGGLVIPLIHSSLAKADSSQHWRCATRCRRFLHIASSLQPVA